MNAIDNRDTALEQLRKALNRKTIQFCEPNHPDNEIEDELKQLGMRA